jgi:hypothetical protein
LREVGFIIDDQHAISRAARFRPPIADRRSGRKQARLATAMKEKIAMPVDGAGAVHRRYTADLMISRGAPSCSARRRHLCPNADAGPAASAGGRSTHMPPAIWNPLATARHLASI